MFSALTHPGQQRDAAPLGLRPLLRGDQFGGQTRRESCLVAREDRRHVVRVPIGAHHHARLAAVADEGGEPLRGRRQRGRAEVARHAVVAHRAAQRREVEVVQDVHRLAADSIAGGAVGQPPGVVAQAGASPGI